MNSKQALIIVDAQVNMFTGKFALFQGERVLAVLSSLIHRARAKAVPVIFIRNNGTAGDPDLPGSPGWQIHPALAPLAGEAVIDKSGPDAFDGTNLAHQLEKQQVRQLVIAGMQTEMCVDASIRRAVTLGYQVNLVADGHTTFDFDDLNAADEIDRVNREIGRIAQVKKAADIAFE